METIEEKNISRYCNISIFEVEEFDLIEYLFYLREAFIFNFSQTEDGMEYLENAWRVEQTEPNRVELRKHFKG